VVKPPSHFQYTASTTSAQERARRILDALACGRPGCACARARRAGCGLTHCPGHADETPSLSVHVIGDRVVVYCHAGCPQSSVLKALRARGLWPPAAPEARETRYIIRDADGAPVAVHVRRDMPGGTKKMWWTLPDGRPGLGGRRIEELPLYGAERLGDAPEVVVVEGEKAADALLRLGIAAVGTVTGAASAPGDAALSPLAGRVVYVWPDADDAGRDHMRRVAERLVAVGAREVRVVAWPDAPDGGDAADYVARGASAADVRRLLAAATPWTPPRATSAPSATFALAALGDLLAEPEEATRWVVDGLLPAGGISVVAAKPKVGKSTLARCLALAVARGEPVLGRATTQGTVIYLALEEKRAEIARHFRALGACERDPIHVHVGSAPKEALEALYRAVEALAPTLVIIDPLFRLARLRDANDYAEVTRALEPLIGLARVSGSHLMLVHHSGKGERAGGDAILGSTALFGSVDTAILMRRAPDGTRTVESVQRYGEDMPPSVVTLDARGAVTLAGTVAERRETEAADAILAALRAAPEPMSEEEIREATGMQATLLARVLRSLVADGAVARSGSGRRGDPYRYAPAEGDFSTSGAENSRVENISFVCNRLNALKVSPPAPPDIYVGGVGGESKIARNSLHPREIFSTDEFSGAAVEKNENPCPECGAEMRPLDGGGHECPECGTVYWPAEGGDGR
jgi:hypothetical protein